MKPLPTYLLLLRHGQSTWNAVGRWQGHGDPPLSELGLAQARTVAAALGDIEVVVSSDLARARQTAEAVAEVVGATVERLDHRLRERDAGEWTGLTRAEIEAGWPGFLDADRRPPAFEPEGAMRERVLDVVADLHARYPGRRVLAVSHGGVLRLLERTVGIDEGWYPNVSGRRWLVDGVSLRASERVDGVATVHGDEPLGGPT